MSSTHHYYESNAARLITHFSTCQSVVLNVWVVTQTWVVIGLGMGREGTPLEHCPVAQKPGKIQPFYGILILSMPYDNKVLFTY